MKNLLIALLFCSPLLGTAQEPRKDTSATKFSIGIMVTDLIVHNFGSNEWFSLKLFNITPGINLITPKTHHHILYGLIENDIDGFKLPNTIQILNGILLPKDYDVYNILSKSLSTKDLYGGVGVEKNWPGKNCDTLFSLEIGTDFAGGNQ